MQANQFIGDACAQFHSLSVNRNFM